MALLWFEWKGDDVKNELTEGLLDGWSGLVHEGFFGTPRQHCERLAESIQPSVDTLIKQHKIDTLEGIRSMVLDAQDGNPMGTHGEQMNETLRWVAYKIEEKIEKLAPPA